MKIFSSIGIVIPTLNAKPYLKRCLLPLFASKLSPKVLVIDSSSTDGTRKEAEHLGALTLSIPRNAFNHGATREKARRFLQTDIAVMMTPDAYFESPEMLEILVEPLLQKKAEVSYARQLPHIGAGFFEAFPRKFNYPEKSHIRSFEDREKYGIYTFFCSNSCAAYVNNALDKIGGFPSVLLGEDTLALSHLLRKGCKVAYVAEARVYHSHNYTLKQEFSRYFDTGLARREYGHFLVCGEKDGKRGASYFRALCKELLRTKPWLLPYAILNTAAKFAGYHFGRMSYNAPARFKKIFSQYPAYWEKKLAKK